MKSVSYTHLDVYKRQILICTTTAFMLLLSGIEIDPNLTGMNYVQAAVQNQVGNFGPLFITISIFLFAFSSLVGNYYYTESNFKFIREMCIRDRYRTIPHR